MDHFVNLDRLPDGFEVPTYINDRLQFDPVRRRLIFRGSMSKTDFHRLCHLTNDWKFRRSLEELFRLATPEVKTGTTGVRRLLAVVPRLFSLG